MKIVRICSGLGNAMFQYCAYLQLKKMFKEEKVYVDTAYYKLTSYPNELPKVLGSTLDQYDINEEFINDKNYLEELDKLRYWKKLGFKNYFEMVKGEKEQVFTKLDAMLSYIELPLLYKRKYKGLHIVSPNMGSMEDIVSRFIENESFLDESKFITVKHAIAELINNRLKGNAKLKYNLLRMPDVRARLIKQLVSFERPDWCHYGNIDLQSLYKDVYYNIYGAPCNIEGVEQEVRAAFKFTQFEDQYNIEMAKKIENSESVAIHARVVNFNYGMKDVLDRNYYNKAISYIKRKSDTPLSFFVFSDNVSWCKENLDKLGISKEDIIFVDYNKGENTFRDMQLMSLCKHIIIPNSTFSWWAGFLINNPKKIFVTPYGTWPGTISF